MNFSLYGHLRLEKLYRPRRARRLASLPANANWKASNQTALNVYICDSCHKETNYRHYIRNGEGKRKTVCRACKVEAKS